MLTVEVYCFEDLPKEIQSIHLTDAPAVSDEFLTIDTGIEFDAFPLEDSMPEELAAWLQEKFDAVSDISENEVYKTASNLCSAVEDLLTYLQEAGKEDLLKIGEGLDFTELLEKAVGDFNDACDNEGLILEEPLQ